MRSRSLPLLLAAAALCVAAPARAQRPLTFDEAITLARKNNFDLRVAKERLRQAYTGVEQAWAPLLPTLAVQGKYTHNYKEVTLDFSQFTAGFTGLATALLGTGLNNPQPLLDYLNQLQAQNAAMAAKPIVIQKGEQLDFLASLTVPLIVPAAYPGLKSAKTSYKAAQATLDVTDASVLVGAAQAFYAAAGFDELVGARQNAIGVAQKTVENARARLEAGVVNKVEVMRAELSLLRARQALKEAEDGRAQTYRTLATLLGLTEPVKVVSPGDVAPEHRSADDLAREALSLRPEYVAYQRNIDAARLSKSSATWRWAPTLSAFGIFRGFNYQGFNGDNYSWLVGLQLDWLLYDGGVRDAQRHLAEAQERENQIRLEQGRAQLTDELYNARRAVDTKRAALETADQSVKLARDTLELVRVQYEAGTATQLDLLAAQDNLVLAEVGLAQARFDLLLADLTLRRSAGLFPGKK